MKISHRVCCITNSFKQRDSAECPAEANLHSRPAEPTHTQEERKKTAQIKEAKLVLSLKGQVSSLFSAACLKSKFHKVKSWATLDLWVSPTTKLLCHQACREWVVSGRGGGFCHCAATEGMPDCAAAARPAGTTGRPACSPSRSAALLSWTHVRKENPRCKARSKNYYSKLLLNHYRSTKKKNHWLKLFVQIAATTC